METCLNIFDSCEIIYYNINNYYKIIYENNKINLYHLKKNDNIIDDDNIKKHLITEPTEIIKNNNIFDGKIIVDINSFNNNNIKNLDEIRNIIIKELNISYIDKLILQKTMRLSFLNKFLKNNNLILLNKFFDKDNNYEDDGIIETILIIEDNNNEIYKIGGYFHERPYDDYEPYYSKFTIIDKQKKT